MSRPRSLKAATLGWVWAIAAIDGVVAIFILDASLIQNIKAGDLAWLRVMGIAVAPPLVLLLTSLLSADAKAVLVFWRLREVLPGHRAFSVYALRDARIDMDALRKNVGKWPDDPADQNRMWFKLYKKVEGDITVAQAHKAYLLFRDLAALSLLLAPIAIVIGYVLDAGPLRSWGAGGVFIAQYASSAIAASNSGVRFVTNALAAHSVKRTTAK